MTYEQLLPIYQQRTGLPGSDDAFNQWVQGIINSTGSQNGIDGIPNDFFNTPAGQTYLNNTPAGTGGGGSGGTGGGGGGGLNLNDLVLPGLPPVDTKGGNYGTSQVGGQTGAYNSTGTTNQTQTGQQTQNTSQNTNTSGNQLTTGWDANEQNSRERNNTTTSGTTTNIGSTTGQSTNEQLTSDFNTQNQAGTSQGSTTGQTATSQQGTSSQTGGQTGVESSTGNQAYQTQGTTRSAVETPFDLAGLVNSQLGQAGQRDASTSSYLTDFMNTGGTGFNSQVDQAVRRSMTGAGMSGAGDSARARAAGYAGAEVARNNAGQRLAAAAQLAGPNATQQALGAISPLLARTSTQAGGGTQSTSGQNVSSGTNYSSGSTTNTGQQSSSGTSNQSTNNTSIGSSQGSNLQQGTQSSTSNNTQQTLQNMLSDITAGMSSLRNQSQNVASTGQQSSTGASSTMDLQSLVGNETNSGTASGQSAQQAGGLVPEGQPVKTGGCIVTTAYVARGWMKPGAIRRACAFKKREWARYGTSLDGYLLYGPLLARAVLRSTLFARAFHPIARAILYEEVRLSAPTRLKRRVGATLAHAVFHYGSLPVGALARLAGCARGITARDMLTLLRDQKLMYRL